MEGSVMHKEIEKRLKSVAIKTKWKNIYKWETDNWKNLYDFAMSENVKVRRTSKGKGLFEYSVSMEVGRVTFKESKLIDEFKVSDVIEKFVVYRAVYLGGSSRIEIKNKRTWRSD